MQGYNVIMVYNNKLDKLLMCKRLKDPYKGLSNLVGGKIEVGEAGIEAAYRELLEETSISKEDIKYHLQDCCVLQSKTLELCKQQFRMLQLDMEPL